MYSCPKKGMKIKGINLKESETQQKFFEAVENNSTCTKFGLCISQF